jgi:hypothetical protein
MAFFSREGKTSGVCRGCSRIKNTHGQCACNSGSTDAYCGGCGAKGYVPDRHADHDLIRSQIGCTCAPSEQSSDSEQPTESGETE